ncbi:MAG: hypothetical protein Q4Q62_07015 [Thermoplasmata archaeon]|nr:hypothetical protein [Thermoplasmata archaeon]
MPEERRASRTSFSALIVWISTGLRSSAAMRSCASKAGSCSATVPLFVSRPTSPIPERGSPDRRDLSADSASASQSPQYHGWTP